MRNLRHATIVGVFALALAACGGGQRAQEAPPEDPTASGGGARGDFNNSRVTDFLGGGAITGEEGGGLTPVNKHLWRASLDTLAFLPLNSTDPFTGVIATDWAASPEAPNERFKVTAYVKSPSLAASSLQVAVFREIRSPEGPWTTAPVSSATARQLEDAILVRARQLRISDRIGDGE